VKEAGKQIINLNDNNHLRSNLVTEALDDSGLKYGIF
jgi:hypothetical protein